MVIFRRARLLRSRDTRPLLGGPKQGPGARTALCGKVDTARTTNTNISPIAGSMNLCSCVSYARAKRSLIGFCCCIVLAMPCRALRHQIFVEPAFVGAVLRAPVLLFTKQACTYKQDARPDKPFDP